MPIIVSEMTQKYENLTPVSEMPLTHNLAARAERYLARFAPLLEMLPPANDIEAQKRLQTIAQLQEEAHFLLIRLKSALLTEEVTLRETIRETLPHLESMATEMQPTLVRDTVSIPDLREKMAERAARKEVESITGVAMPTTQEILIAPRSIPGFLAAGGFALFWNGFTLVHATLMIGGMYKAFGFMAFFMLFFYALFFGAGFAILKTSLNFLATHTLSLTGNQLCLVSDFGKNKKERLFTLNRSCRVERLAGGSKQRGASGKEIAIIDASGREFRFGSTLSTERQKEIVSQLKSYLRQLH
jgi:hypothetical protein